MAEIHYLISDASKKVDVEALCCVTGRKNWNFQFRNDMGHRYYTDFHIRLLNR